MIKKRMKSILAICLAMLLAVSALVIPANAKGISTESLPDDLAKFMKMDFWIYTHLKEDVEIVKELENGNTEILDKYFPDPEDKEFFLRMDNLSRTIGDVAKTATTTMNPQNQERNVVPTMEVKTCNSEFPPAESITGSNKKDNYTFLTTHVHPGIKIGLDVFFIYKDTNGNLVAFAIMTNNSGAIAEVAGIPYVDLLVDGKSFAGGTSSSFEKPIKLSPRKNQANLGVYDGLPTKCFVKIIFTPGTYDNTINISDLDNINLVYTMDYQVLK